MQQSVGLTFVLASFFLVSSCSTMKQITMNPAERSTIYNASYEKVFNTTLYVIQTEGYSIERADADTGTIIIHYGGPSSGGSSDLIPAAAETLNSLTLMNGEYGGTKIIFHWGKDPPDSEEPPHDSPKSDRKIQIKLLEQIREEIQHKSR